MMTRCDLLLCLLSPSALALRPLVLSSFPSIPSIIHPSQTIMMMMLPPPSPPRRMRPPPPPLPLRRLLLLVVMPALLLLLVFAVTTQAFVWRPPPWQLLHPRRTSFTPRFFASTHTLPPGAVVPEHLALILDGNGRWAQQRGLPRGAGHMEGAKRAFEVLKTCQALGVRTVTLYCLSTENWKRPAAEVSLILGCVESSLRANLDYAHKNRIRLVVVGQTHRLPPTLQALVAQAEEETAAYSGMTVCLALSYGGREDIVQACRALANQAVTGEVQAHEIDEARFEAQLSTHRKGILHPPDLVVRTSGERRWSNFMLFECAYSEFYVADVLWPDFSEADLLAALDSYGQRSRRFGGVAAEEEREKRKLEKTSALPHKSYV